MEYILNNRPGEIDYSPYLAYVESIREQLPPHVYAFASDIRYFDLESHSSLHDSWLESFTVREVATGGGRRSVGWRLPLLCLALSMTCGFACIIPESRATHL